MEQAKEKESRQHHKHHKHSHQHQKDEEDKDIEKKKRRRHKETNSELKSDKVEIQTSIDDSELDSLRKNILKREEWMVSQPPGKLNIGHAANVKSNEQQRIRSSEQDLPKISERELNPYLKHYGAALPSKPEQRIIEEKDDHISSLRIGDGGASWRMRQLKRLKEQAESEHRPIEDIAIERWGSLSYLKALEEENETGEITSKNDKREGERHLQHDDMSEYIRTAKKIMKIPKELPPSSLKWQDIAEGDYNPIRAKNSNESNENTSQEISNSTDQRAIKVLSEMNLNQLAAKILKAELAGDAELVRNLSEQLKIEKERVHMSKQSLEKNRCNVNKEEKEVLVLPRVDSHGQLMQSKVSTRPHCLSQSSSSHQKKNYEQFDKEGRRIRYFKDDEVDALDTLLKKEKAYNYSFDDEYAQNIVRNSQFNNSLDYLDEYGEQYADRISNRIPQIKKEEKQRRRAIQDYQRMESIQEKCWFCFENVSLPKHLIISLGINVYLSLPQRGFLTEGHCLIVPIHHIGATMSLDENVWEEIRNFKKCLIRMFDVENKGVVFLETVYPSKKQHHTFIDCIPLPYGFFQEAAFFRKAIQESESEWTQNSKLIDTSGKGLKRSIPPNFSYFNVEFGLDNGFVHIIENADKFPHYFGREVIGGMLDKTPDHWLHPSKQSFEQEKSRATHFVKWWEPFDWTKQLNDAN